MTFKLLIKKLYLIEKKIITSDLLRDYCKKLDLNYYTVIRYLISNKYLYRILKGIFYKPSVEERKFNKLDISYLDALAKALEIKGVKNWYFGLETSIKLHGLSHEYFTTDFIINDTLFRAKAISVLGRKIKFIKLKKELFGFGIIKIHKSGFLGYRRHTPSPSIVKNVSDIEKTLLDIAYLSKYAGLGVGEINNKISDLFKHCSKNKLLEYSKKYNKSMESFVKELL